MAIFDAMLEFSDDQDIGANSASSTEASTNVLNFTQADLEMGAGEPLWLNVKMGTEALLSTGAATLTVALCRDTDGTIDGSSTVIYQTPAIAKASLTAGAWILRMPLPYNVDEDAYIGLLYTVGSHPSTAGTVDAFIDHGPQSSYDTQVSASNI
jgi:hypothetical protein